jgi:hypothetical protein
MARINLAQINANEFALTYNWKLDAVIPNTIPGITAGDYGGETQILNLSCISSDLPKSSIKSISQNIRGIQTIQSGGQLSDQHITLVFAERRDWKVSKLFELWRQYIFSMADGTGNSKAAYITDDFRLRLLTEKDGDTLQQQATYSLRYAYPEQVSYEQLGADPGSIAKTTVVMAFATHTITYP